MKFSSVALLTSVLATVSMAAPQPRQFCSEADRFGIVQITPNNLVPGDVCILLRLSSFQKLTEDPSQALWRFELAQVPDATKWTTQPSSGFNIPLVWDAIGDRSKISFEAR